MYQILSQMSPYVCLPSNFTDSNNVHANNEKGSIVIQAFGALWTAAVLTYCVIRTVGDYREYQREPNEDQFLRLRVRVLGTSACAYLAGANIRILLNNLLC